MTKLDEICHRVCHAARLDGDPLWVDLDRVSAQRAMALVGPEHVLHPNRYSAPAARCDQDACRYEPAVHQAPRIGPFLGHPLIVLGMAWLDNRTLLSSLINS